MIERKLRDEPPYLLLTRWWREAGGGSVQCANSANYRGSVYLEIALRVVEGEPRRKMVICTSAANRKDLGVRLEHPSVNIDDGQVRVTGEPMVDNGVCTDCAPEN